MAYIISKSGLELLTAILAKTYSPRLRVNTLALGMVMPSEEFSRKQWNEKIARLPLGHSVEPADLSGALEFILDNRSITGQTIVVDSGYKLM